MDLEEVVQSVVSNLHQSQLSNHLSEWYAVSAMQIRKDLGISSDSEESINTSDSFEKVRQYIFSKVFQEEEIVNFLLDVPKWAGFQVDKTSISTLEQTIENAKHSAISAIWLMALPQIIISHIVSPHEFENQGVDLIIRDLLESDNSRRELNDVLYREFSNRGLDTGHFSMDGVIRGYTIKETNRKQRLRAVIALILMKSSGCPFDLDAIFSLDENSLIDETTAYVITMHTKKMLSDRITGSRSSRPFDWPLTGTIRVFSGLVSTLNVLMKYAERITTCSLFSSDTKEGRVLWTEHEFISNLVQEIAENYSETLHSQNDKNEELNRFIDLLNGENFEITSRVMSSDNIAAALYDELLECKRRARIGEKPQISPERRFKVILNTLKQRLSGARIDKVPSDEVIDQIADTYDAITEIIQKHKESLGNEIDKFTEELCFETSFRILELLDLGGTLVDLPWVSRFVAEEAAIRDISEGDIVEFRDEQRIQRIISAYAGGVVYLVLQAWD